MNLDDLKKQWQQEQHTKNTAQIEQMVRGRSASVSAKTERKALIEAAAFVLVLIVFFTGLDPEKNSLWVNLLFLAAASLGIINNVWLYRSLTLNRRGEDIRSSLQNIVRRLWVQIQFSVIFSVLFFSSMMAFLMLSVPLSAEKLVMILALLGASIAIRSGVEIRKWTHSIRKLNVCLEMLSPSEKM